jgi:putative flippase GtrA
MNQGHLRFGKYSLIGFSTFAFDLVLLYVFIDVLKWPQVFSVGFAFLIAVSINYALSRQYVFKGTLRSVKTGYINFLIIAGTGLLFVTLGMYVLSEMLAVHYLLARVLVALFTGFWNYLMNLYVNFKVAGKHVD